MNLEQKIMADLKTAMKEKNKTALEALRAVKSAILLHKTDAKGEMTEADEIAILQKQVKMRKDAAEQFKAQGRDEMAENELSQAAVIEKFLPEQMDMETLKEKIQEIISQVNAEGMKDMGKVMGIANKELAGKADGKSIADTVKNLLNQ